LRRMRFLACGVFAIDRPLKFLCFQRKSGAEPVGRTGVALP
jgi:hypothetical protein